jgi:hypothetical protein
MLASTWGDSLFPPNQLVSFVDRLTGPKRLELMPGDHVSNELLGVFGLPAPIWDDALRWFDQYIGGVATGIDTEPSIALQPVGQTAIERYGRWSDVAATTRRLALGAVDPGNGTGDLGPTAATGWNHTITAGVDTIASGGTVMLTNAISGSTGLSPVVWLPVVDRANAGVWVTGAQPDTVAIRGITRLHLALRDAPASGTVVAYLYDVGLWGFGQLITHASVTWLTRTEATDPQHHGVAGPPPARSSSTPSTRSTSSQPGLHHLHRHPDGPSPRSRRPAAARPPPVTVTRCAAAGAASAARSLVASTGAPGSSRPSDRSGAEKYSPASSARSRW